MLIFCLKKIVIYLLKQLSSLLQSKLLYTNKAIIINYVRDVFDFDLISQTELYMEQIILIQTHVRGTMVILLIFTYLNVNQAPSRNESAVFIITSF